MTKEENFDSMVQLSKHFENIAYNNTLLLMRLEWLVWYCLENDYITQSKGRELLGYETIEDFREWFNNYKEQTK